MDFIKELLSEASKKKVKVAKSSRRAVYHADYVKTKNKPYRKYHKDDHHVTESDEWEMSSDVPEDDMEGPEMGVEADDVAQGADGHADIAAELARIIDELSELLSQYDECDGETEEPSSEEPTEEPSEEQRPGSSFSPQFSSWLQKTSGVTLNEFGSTALPMTRVASINTVGSKTKDDYKSEAADRVRKLASHFKQDGAFAGSLNVLKHLTTNHHQKGGKHGERIFNIVQKYLSK